jgi:hypothetical protein
MIYLPVINLPVGKVMLATEFIPDGTAEGSGMLSVCVHGKLVGQGKLSRSVFRHGLEPFEIGRGSIILVSPGYQIPLAFRGTIERIPFELLRN